MERHIIKLTFHTLCTHTNTLIREFISKFSAGHLQTRWLRHRVGVKSVGRAWTPTYVRLYPRLTTSSHASRQSVSVMHIIGSLNNNSSSGKIVAKVNDVRGGGQPPATSSVLSNFFVDPLYANFQFTPVCITLRLCLLVCVWLIVWFEVENVPHCCHCWLCGKDDVVDFSSFFFFFFLQSVTHFNEIWAASWRLPVSLKEARWSHSGS